MMTDNTSSRFSHAIVCRPGTMAMGPSIGIPDDARAASQHQKYCDALRACGVELTFLDTAAAGPGSVFAGTGAIVTDTLAIIGNAAPYERQRALASLLAGERFIKFIMAPGLLDPADVLKVGNKFYIALSAHTNTDGAAQLGFYLNEAGYDVTILKADTVPLRLRTSVTCLDNSCLLIRKELADLPAFAAYKKITVPFHERGAAQALMVNGTLLLPAGYAETAAVLRGAGFSVLEMNISEFEKVGGGLGGLALPMERKMAQRPDTLNLTKFAAQHAAA